jgi:hypothetical protein
MTDIETDNVIPLQPKPFDESAALAWLRSQPGGRTDLAPAELARRWGCPRYKITRWLQRWRRDGLVEQRGNRLVAVPSEVTLSSLQHADVPREALPLSGRSVAVTDAARNAATVTTSDDDAHIVRLLRLDEPGLVPGQHPPPGDERHRGAVDIAAYLAAITLASAAAYFSIRGMVVLFPSAPVAIVVMAIAMESAKLVTAAWLARRWGSTVVLWRAVLVCLVAGLALINAAGVYAQLVSAHVGERGAAQAGLEIQDADLGARIEVATSKITDLDRRISQIDIAIEEAARRGRTNTALSAIEGQRRARAGLVDERNREAGALAALKAERASVAAKGRQMETEAAPIRYVAELLGASTDSERAIRWLIALIVLCCDPLAITLTAATAAQRT